MWDKHLFKVNNIILQLSNNYSRSNDFIVGFGHKFSHSEVNKRNRNMF